MNNYFEHISYSWSEDSIRYINTPTLSSKKNFLYVQEIGDFKTNSSYFTERSNLDSYLIIYTLSGKGTLTCRQHEYMLEPGDICYIHCMEHHYYQCASNEHWDFLWVHFNGNFARGYFEEFVKTGFHIIHADDCFYIESTLRRILSLTIKKDLNAEVISSNLINNLITLLIEKSSTNNGLLSYMPPYIIEIMKYIDQHFLEELTLEQISDQFYFSQYHISRVFKQYTGITFSEYLITSRLSYAKELLKYTNKTVNEITFACGMNNVSHFISLFKKHEEMTPLQYRKEWNQ